MKTGKLTKDELKAKVSKAIDDAKSYADGTLKAERKRAMDYYFGKPFGDEVEGRSKVVSTDVAEVIEWILPDLMKIFTSTNSPVNFDPEGPEDEAGAKQATDYVNYIFTKENTSFLVLYTWFKDALLQKNGVVKYGWQTKEKVKEETFPEVNDMAFGVFMDEIGDGKEDENGNKVEVVDHTETESEPDEFGVVNKFHRFTVRTTKKKDTLRVYNLPPEEFLIDSGAKTIEDATFVAHYCEKSRSDLIEMGYSRKEVDELTSDDALSIDESSQSRELYDDWDDNDRDDQTTKVPVYECYMNIDLDDDGIAELNRIVVAGGQRKVMEVEKAEEKPFASICPVPTPHEFYGQSVADLVMDLQKIKSTILRQILDNMYLTNNSRNVVVDGQVNLDDLMTNRPGGVVRAKSIGAIQPLVTQPLSQQAFGMLEQMNNIREERTGVTKYTQGMDADTLNKTASGINQIMNASQQRIELIARIFAETGVKRLFKLLLNTVVRNADSQKSEMIRLRNQWVEMSPGQWDPDMDLTVQVGLGTGNKDQNLAHLNNILNVQKEAIAVQGGVDGPLTSVKYLHHTMEKIIENSGQKSTEMFMPELESYQPPPPQQEPPSPEMMKAQAEIADMNKRTDAEIAIKVREQDRKDRELALKAEQMNRETALEVQKIATNAPGGDGNIPDVFR